MKKKRKIQIDTPIRNNIAGFKLHPYLLVITFVLLIPQINAGILDNIYDFGVNTFTSKEAINKHDVRIEANKHTLLDGSEGYLSIDITELGKKDKDFNLDLSFENNLCEVLWYEKYDLVNKSSIDCITKQTGTKYDARNDTTYPVYEDICSVNEDYELGWIKVNTLQRFKSHKLKLLTNKKQSYRAYVNCIPGSKGKYNVYTYSDDGTTELDPTFESSEGDFKGTHNDTVVSGSSLNLSSGKTIGKFTSVGFGSGLKRNDWGTIKIDSNIPTRTSTDEAHGKTFDGLYTSATEYFALNVSVKTSKYLFSATKSTLGDDTSTHFVLMDDQGNHILNETYSGNTATLSTPYLLEAGKSYFMGGWASGTWSVRHNDAAELPTVDTYVDWVVGMCSGNPCAPNALDRIYNVESIVVGDVGSSIQVNVCYSDTNATNSFGHCDFNVTDGFSLTNETAKYMNWSEEMYREATAINPGIYNISIDFTILNDPPLMPTNLNPVDYTYFTTTANIDFNWSNATDPNGDLLTYDFEIYNDTKTNTNAHGETLGNTGSITQAYGFLFEAQRGTRLTRVTTSDPVTATNCNLTDAGLNVLAQSSITDNNASFDYPLVAGTRYFIYCDNNGLSYNKDVSAAASYPYTFDDISLIASFNSGELPNPLNNTGAVLNILSIDTVEPLNIYHQETGITEIATPTGYTLPLLTPDGDYFWRARSYDDLEYSNWSELLTIFVDTLPPGVAIQSPLNTTFSTTSQDLNVWCSDLASNCTNHNYNLNGAGNQSFTPNTTITSVDGSNTLDYCAADDFSNLNCTTVSFTVDLPSPLLNITFPLNTTYKETITELNYSVFHNITGLDTCWYSLDSGITNVTSTCDTNITSISSGQGDEEWFTYANDTLGNENQSKQNFFVDSINPVLTVDSPLNTSYGFRNINLNVTGTDTNIDSYFYSLDWGLNTSFTPNSTVEVTQGSHTIVLYVNDTLNNIAQNITSFYANDTTILPFTLLFNKTTLAGSRETFYTNITFNPVSIADINLTFNYNNTNYTTIRTNLTNTHIQFETTFNVPDVSTSTTKNVYGFVDLFYINGSTGENYTTLSTQTINNFYVFYCENGSNATSYLAYNFSFKSEANDTFINQSNIRANFRIWSDDLSVNSTILVDETNIPSFPVCVSPADQSFRIDSVIEYEKSGTEILSLSGFS